MSKTIQILCMVFCIVFCISLPIASLQSQDPAANRLLFQDAKGVEVPTQYIKAPVVSTLLPPIIIPAGPPQVITRSEQQHAIGPLEVERIKRLSTSLVKKGNSAYPSVQALINKPFLAGIPEKVLAKPMLKKNTGPDIVSTYDLSNGLKDITIEKMYQDHQDNIWATTVYGGAFKFDGKYFHYMGEEQGLPSNTVLNMLFTTDHEIWFGTLDGLSKYDGKYLTNYTTESGLLNNWIVGVEEDQYGNIWVFSHGGLQMIEKAHQTIYTFNIFPKKYGHVNRMTKDSKDNIWMSWGGNALFIISAEKKTEAYNFKLNYFEHDYGGIGKYYEDDQGNMWISASKSLFKITTVNSDFETLISTNYDLVMNSAKQRITNVTGDGKNNILISTRRSGVFILDPDQDAPSFRILKGPYDIPDSFVSGIFCDHKHNIWMASDGLTLIRNKPYHIFNSIASPNSIVEDHQNNMWVGASHGIYKYNPKSPDKLLLFGKSAGLPSSDISDLIVDKNGHIWIATLGEGIIIFEPDIQNASGIFKHYPRAKGIPSEFITAFIEDSNKDIWFSSYENSAAPTSGVAKIVGNKMTFIGVDQGLIHEDVMAMDYDIFGNFWIGSWGLGLNKYKTKSYEEKGKVTQFTSKQIPIENRVRTVMADRNGNVWSGGYGAVGITQFFPSHNGTSYNIRHFSLAQGLSSTNLLSALEDTDGNLWFGTAYGLNFLDKNQVVQPSDNRPIVSFTLEDGFPAASCKNNVLFQSSDNLIWVGGDDRLIYFDPKELILKPVAPSVFLQEVSLFNQSTEWKKDTSIVLGNGRVIQGFRFDSLSNFDYLPQGLELSFDNNFIDFDYSANSVDENHNFIYQTNLKGLESGWGSSSSVSKISYNGLGHGEYTFMVRAKFENGNWGAPLSFSFVITPPWWLTWWAYSLYFIAGILSIFMIYRFQIKRNLETAEALRLKELDIVKTRLYTNITHEFRTPLTVISGMSAQIKESPKEWLREGLPMIERNASRLLNLVNQLLNLNKLENGKMVLHFEQGDIIAYLKYLVASIHSFAESENIQLHFYAVEDEVVMDYDPQKIEQLVINLLSNALKFTPSGGHVYMDVNLTRSLDNEIVGSTTNAIIAGPLLKISIRDNGSGISEDQIPFIFNRFYQVDDSSTRQEEGSGIGLALVKELIELMNGEISVNSKLGKGTIFTILLPIRNEAPKMSHPLLALNALDDIQSENVSPVFLNQNGKSSSNSSANSKPEILLIEDNRDVVTYIAACLQNSYSIKVGNDGQEGIEIAFESIPDLIITDVMMPYRDGFDVCNSLKNDERTSHIPIIMLTAKSDLESKLTGLEKGADAYLSKPFHKAELLLRVKKLLELRKKLQNHYLNALGIHTLDFSNTQDSVTAQTSHMTTDPVESLGIQDPFGQKLMAIVESNLANFDFKVENLCKEIGMSRSQLQRKLSALTGISPNKFIRQVRLNQAKKLLQEPATSISEVAFSTGFNDPSYFGRVFKQEFGMTPNEWKEKSKHGKKT